ncbi:MAG: hypothetical protein IT383_26975 [Deltaproteobacteria bacterium]|nr:hypothetical protein [Deltaproteobacteria bacterium]
MSRFPVALVRAARFVAGAALLAAFFFAAFFFVAAFFVGMLGASVVSVPRSLREASAYGYGEALPHHGAFGAATPVSFTTDNQLS